MAEYNVKFEVFEGPLDLLLYLIKKEEVDIYQVNLTKLATDFLEYIEVMRLLDLEIAGEFLVMAATLLYIKSRELLPVDQQQVPQEGEDDGEDPRWELIRQLVEYKKFKDAAATLQTLEATQDDIYQHIPAKQHFEEPAAPVQVSLFDLINAVNAVLKRLTQDNKETRDVYEDRWTVSEKIQHLLELLRVQPRVQFSTLFAAATNRSEVVVTFLAMLELIRLRQLVAVQESAFGDIEILPAPPQPESPPPGAAAEGAAAESASRIRVDSAASPAPQALDSETHSPTL